jgi:hypothetical protein
MPNRNHANLCLKRLLNGSLQQLVTKLRCSAVRCRRQVCNNSRSRTGLGWLRARAARSTEVSRSIARIVLDDNSRTVRVSRPDRIRQCRRCDGLGCNMRYAREGGGCGARHENRAVSPVRHNLAFLNATVRPLRWLHISLTWCSCPKGDQREASERVRNCDIQHDAFGQVYGLRSFVTNCNQKHGLGAAWPAIRPRRKSAAGARGSMAQRFSAEGEWNVAGRRHGGRPVGGENRETFIYKTAAIGNFTSHRRRIDDIEQT